MLSLDVAKEMFQPHTAAVEHDNTFGFTIRRFDPQVEAVARCAIAFGNSDRIGVNYLVAVDLNRRRSFID